MNDQPLSARHPDEEARRARKERSARYHRLISMDSSVLPTPELNAILKGEVPMPKELT